ncbi:MAG: PilZ domain-containing protein [Methylovirgula sp.]|uniref:PilZ domain-containing protein n=1 Tax=Methylovirgula sp. TaxID=1978224 RepID=UPI00307682CF
MQEHRTTERVRSFLRAQIVFNNRMTTIECIIKNYSAAGAKIALNDTLTVPTEFDVYIPAKHRNHHARLVWRDKDSIGVNFVEAGAAVATKTPADRLRELELQNAELKSRVRELSKRLEDLGQDPNIAA